MVQPNISIIMQNLYGTGMFRILPFLEIFNKKFNIEMIGGVSKTQSKITTHFSEDIFKSISIKPFYLYISYSKPHKFFNFLNISKLIKGDLIICYKLYMDVLIPSFFKKILNKKFLVIDIDDYEPGMKITIFHKLKRFVDLIIVGSITLQKVFGGFYIPTPVNTELFKKKNFDRNLIRKKYGLGDSPIILYMGTFRSHKGIKEIFKIFSLVIKERKDIKLLMIGGHEDKKINQMYVEYGKRMCRDQVIFTGFRPHTEMPLFLSTADIFLTPVKDHFITRFQTPAKIAEAQSMELPIVSSAVGEYKNLINDGINGFLLDPNDLAGFKDKIIYLLENEKERENFGQKARDSCLENCSFESIEKKIFDIFNRYAIF